MHEDLQRWVIGTLVSHDVYRFSMSWSLFSGPEYDWILETIESVGLRTLGCTVERSGHSFLRLRANELSL